VLLARTTTPMTPRQRKPGRARSTTSGAVHVPVLLEPLLAAARQHLGRAPRGLVVDGTLGAGGHATALLNTFEEIELLGLDWDPDSLTHGRAALAPFGTRARTARSRLADLGAALTRECGPAARPIAIIADLGVCSLHFDRPERGFSLQADGPLDMRMDPDLPSTAADIVNEWEEEQLADLFFHQGGERRARRVAKALVTARKRAPFLRTLALADLVERELGPGGRVHAATRVFQALRIVVNGEEAQLTGFLAAAEACLAPGGLLAVITFHSGEDGVVKRRLEDAARRGAFHVLTKKPIAPTHAEERANPRARSARLRLALRTLPKAEALA